MRIIANIIRILINIIYMRDAIGVMLHHQWQPCPAQLIKVHWGGGGHDQQNLISFGWFFFGGGVQVLMEWFLLGRECHWWFQKDIARSTCTLCSINKQLTLSANGDMLLIILNWIEQQAKCLQDRIISGVFLGFLTISIFDMTGPGIYAYKRCMYLCTIQFFQWVAL